MCVNATRTCARIHTCRKHSLEYEMMRGRSLIKLVMAVIACRWLPVDAMQARVHGRQLAGTDRKGRGTAE